MAAPAHLAGTLPICARKNVIRAPFIIFSIHSANRSDARQLRPTALQIAGRATYSEPSACCRLDSPTLGGAASGSKPLLARALLFQARTAGTAHAEPASHYTCSEGLGLEHRNQRHGAPLASRTPPHHRHPQAPHCPRFWKCGVCQKVRRRHCRGKLRGLRRAGRVVTVVGPSGCGKSPCSISSPGWRSRMPQHPAVRGPQLPCPRTAGQGVLHAPARSAAALAHRYR